MVISVDFFFCFFFVNGFNIFFATEVVRISNAVYLKDLLVGFPGSSS